FTVQFMFFFSSRRRHTRFSRDWSSDVCSSDLKLPILAALAAAFLAQPATAQPASAPRTAVVAHADLDLATHKGVKTLDRRIWRRSEERRVGKECRCRSDAYA